MSETPSDAEAALKDVPVFREQKKKGLLRRTLGFIVKVIVLAIVAFHAYALVLRFVPVPFTVLMVQRAAQGKDVRRDWTSINEISPHLVRAVIAAEDAKFCAHGGIDREAIEKAIKHNKKSKRRRGGSTVTQQTAKNVFFWNGGGMVRKAGEAWMALVIDKVWGKRRVMEVYLNVAEWGDGLFGAEAAAQARFGKSAKDITKREAALLAAVLPSPHKWRVDPPGPYVRKRTGTLQARMNVIESEGYAACVLSTDEGRAPPPPAKGDKREKGPPPEPVLPDLPDAPEDGSPEALVVDEEGAPIDTVAPSENPATPEGEAALDAVLDAVETAPPAEAPAPEPAPQPEPTPEETGPAELRPGTPVP